MRSFRLIKETFTSVRCTCLTQVGMARQVFGRNSRTRHIDVKWFCCAALCYVWKSKLVSHLLWTCGRITTRHALPCSAPSGGSKQGWPRGSNISYSIPFTYQTIPQIDVAEQYLRFDMHRTGLIFCKYFGSIPPLWHEDSSVQKGLGLVSVVISRNPQP